MSDRERLDRATNPGDRNEGRDATGGSYTGNRDTPGSPRPENREKSTVDKLIDKAQEKGVFEKAERLFKDKLGGNKKRR